MACTGPFPFGPVGLLVALGALVPPTSAPATDPYTRQPGLDAEHYVFRVELNDSTDEIAGEADVTLRFVEPGVTRFWLDLSTVRDGGEGRGEVGMTVAAVTSEGRPVPFTHADDRLTLTLAAAPAVDERRTFTVRYRGVPADGLMIGPDRYGERTFFSWNWPDEAREWLPTIDHPSDKATSEFVITAPAAYQVVANGLLQEERDLNDGRRVTHWKQSVPIATWLNAIGVAPFSSRHLRPVLGIPFQTWVLRQDAEAGRAAFDEDARRAMEFFVEKIGPYPYEKLANVQAAGGGGGTEHASVIFYGQNVVDRNATGVVAHEIAHQWWGDAVTERDWDEVWLSEGFATYFTHLFYEHYEGRDVLVARMKNDAQRVLATERENPGEAVIHDDLSDMENVLRPSRIVYQKGGWVLHMLRGQIGTEAFWRGIRDYYRRHRNGNTSTAEFRRVMEEASGQELGWFFDQWTTRWQSPVVEGSWRWDPGAKAVVVELAQTQPGAPYRLPLQVGIVPSPGEAPRVEDVELMGPSGRFELAADAEPADVVLDPDTWILMDATFGKR